jgi:hypothetical protein
MHLSPLPEAEAETRETLNKSHVPEAILPMHGKASSDLGDLETQNSST